MKRYLIFGMAPFVLGSGDVLAQSDEPAASQLRLEEVVVTSRRREEPLQEVPTSVQIVSGEVIARQSISSVLDLQETLPSIHISNDGAGGQAFIRGVGSGQNMIFNQSVASFVDDIYHGSARSTAASFLDVERVEVLKGPQTTFFGNNAIAGALNIVTTRPSMDGFGGYARGLYGEYGQYVGEAAMNIPVTDDFALRVAGNFNGQDGWQDNDYVGEKQPNRKNRAGRLSARWRPGDFDVFFKVEGSKNETHSGQVIGNCPPPEPYYPLGFCRTALQLGIPTLGLDAERNTSGPQGFWLDTVESVLSVKYNRGGHTFSSVTGYSTFDGIQHLDADALPMDGLNYYIEENYRQFSQEFRIESPSGQTLEYMAGLYFQTDNKDGNPGGLNYFYLTPTIAANPAYAALAPYLPIGQQPRYVQDEDVYSIFASLSWNVTDDLKLNGGLRSSWVHKDATMSAFNGTATRSFGGVVPFPEELRPVLDPLAASLIGAVVSVSNAETYHALMPSVGVQYTFAPERMFYATFTRGSKAGTPVTSFTSVQSAPIKPEYVNAYEAGVKTSWLNNTLLLNLAVYRQEYSDLQVNAFTTNPITGALILGLANAAESRSQGVEFEGQWLLSRHFRMSGSLAYMDSIFTDYRNANPTTLMSFCRNNMNLSGCAERFPDGVPARGDYSGLPTTFAPDWSGSVTGTFSTELSGSWNLTAAVTSIFSSSFYLGNGAPNDLLVQDSYVRWDGRLGVETADGAWAVDLIGKNLTDRRLYGGGNQATGQPTSSGSLLVQPEQPRNLAIQVRHKF